MGHSLGAASAAFAGTNSLIKKIILLSPLNPCITDYSPSTLKEWLSPRTIEVAEESLENLVSKTSNKDYFASIVKQAARFVSFAAKNKGTLNHLIKNQIINKEYLLQNLLPLYELVGDKVVYINGTEDKFVPYQSTEKTSNLTKSILYTINKCGHAPIYEKSNEMNKIINELVKLVI